MKIKIKNWIRVVMMLMCVACTNDNTLFIEDESASEGVRIVLAPQGMPEVEVRSAANETGADSRIEHVIVYVFNEAGTDLLQRFQQDLEHPDREVRPLLPQGQTLKVHAVCNYPQLWKETISNEQALESKMLTIDHADGAFNGAMVMHGDTTLTAQDVAEKNKENKIRVTRIAARITLDLSFNPDVKTDKFYLTSIRLCNIPKRSWLKMRPQINGDTIQRATGDATYTQDLQDKQQKEYYFTEMLLPHTTDDRGHSFVETYLFENRWGCEPNDERYSNKFAQNTEMWQTLKGEAAQDRPYSSYLKIEGYYLSGKKTVATSYRIYLGTDNYKDFNVYRNAYYNVSGVIRACNKLDTRVEMTLLGGSQISPSFNNPLDAHFNAAPCFGFTYNDWELYVEEPDKHPWLEISFSSQYRPRIAGKPMKPDEEHFYAGTRFEGKGGMAAYFYVHTDEYIPENPAADEGLNNTMDEKLWRTGYVVLRDKKNGSTYRLEVKQRPAQVVRMPVKDLFGHVKFYNEYYIEYELERKNITWGFLKYGANPVMTSMINDRWDGLANTRRLYEEAIKVGDPNDNSLDADIYRGAYNGYNTVDKEYPWINNDTLAVINRIPENHMIKYVLGKNRDRNGNGYIDYDEIVWYVPALDELAVLKEKLDAHLVVFQNSGERFHSSTPYLAGYSAEVPGRAFYVKMGQGEKAFAMRDRQYNVICCRRKNAWTGDPNAGIGGNITVDPGWKPDEEDILPKN